MDTPVLGYGIPRTKETKIFVRIYHNVLRNDLDGSCTGSVEACEAMPEHPSFKKPVGIYAGDETAPPDRTWRRMRRVVRIVRTCSSCVAYVQYLEAD
eukprot:110050-Pleurochrysis_carterae.AAC.1